MRKLQELMGTRQSVVQQISAARAAYQRAEYKMQLFMNQFQLDGAEKISENHL